MATESVKEQQSRLQQMAEDDGDTWDLSDNDRAACLTGAQAIDRAATLRTALVTLVGADGREELEAMEAAIRASVAPAVDKAAGIDAIQALLATLPEAK